MPTTAESHSSAMERVTGGLPTKSAKIRALDDAGYKRTQIADFLGIRYQHVRNVLVQREATNKRDAVAPPQSIDVTVGPGGRIVVPAPYREALAIDEGDELVIRLSGNELRVTSREHDLRQAQELVRKYVPEGVDLVEDLIRTRRAEAEEENKDG